MHKAAITYRNEELEACEQDDLWTVSRANLEVRAGYLDFALAELLGNAPEAHRLAARLLAKLTDVVEERETAYPPVAAVPPRRQRSTPRHELWAKPLRLGVRILAFAAVASTAFMLTTWFSTLR